MKKITLAISSILLLSSSAFAMDANQVANSIDHVNQAALNKDTQNIQQLQSLINAAKSGQYVNAVIASANFISTTAPQFNALDNDPTLSNMIHVNGQKSIEELNKALQNVKYLDQFDQHLNSAYDYSQKAWQDRLDFLNTNQSQPAQQFNILLNYFVLNSMTLSPSIHNLQQAASAYTQMNVMSYQIPVDAYQVCTKAQNKIAEILQVTPAMVVTEIQQLRKNATVDKINQASLDIHNNIQEILNFKYEFKVLNVTIFTVEMPKQIVNFVNDALKKSGMSDTFEALQFLMTANAKGGSVPLAADFNQVKACQNSNQYAKLMMGLSEALSKRFSSDYGLSQEQAYYAITYMLAHQLNHNI